MKIITVNVNKGGTGKSTISYNLAKYMTERKNKKVLLLDGDRSCNLSFSFSELGDSTIADIFNNKPVEVYPISNNLDFIKGSSELEDNILDLQSRQNNCMLFFLWISDNYEQIKKYDYVIIDTHNDSSLVTSNFLAVSNMVLGVSEPSRNGYRAWLELIDTIEKLKSDIIDLRTRESYIKAIPYLIGNRVDHLGNSSKQFLEKVQTEDNYLGMVQKKELLAKTLLEDISIFEKQDKMTDRQKKEHEAFYNSVTSLFDTIIQTVDKL